MSPISGNSARLRAMWLGASLLYGGARVALAGAFLAEYGLNIWVFGAIEMASSLVLGLASGALVESIVRACRRRRMLLIAGTVGGYAAPDVYVLAYSGTFPTTTLVLVAVVMIAGVVSTAVGLRSRLRRA